MTRRLVIDGTEITGDSDCYVVAELGCNHMGSVETAKEMIRFASFYKVDAVKLEKRDNPALFTKQMFDSSYINRKTASPRPTAPTARPWSSTEAVKLSLSTTRSSISPSRIQC